jgi:hypothetical protein
MDSAHVKTTEEVLEHFQVDPTKGLTSAQVGQRQKTYGKNGMTYEGLKDRDAHTAFIAFQ